MPYMTNLTLLFIEMLFSNMFFECSLYLVISTFGLKLTLSKLNVFTKYSNNCFAHFNVLFYLTLCDLNITSSAVNLNFIIELHHDSIRLFHFCYGLAVRTGGRP
jgi:hypothetical protein